LHAQQVLRASEGEKGKKDVEGELWRGKNREKREKKRKEGGLC